MNTTVEEQEFISFPQAAKLFFKRTSVSTLHRWRLDGIVKYGQPAIKLNAVDQGGLNFTTRAWVEEFNRELEQRRRVWEAERRRLRRAKAVPTPVNHAQADAALREAGL